MSLEDNLKKIEQMNDEELKKFAIYLAEQLEGVNVSLFNTRSIARSIIEHQKGEDADKVYDYGDLGILESYELYCDAKEINDKNKAQKN